MPIDPASRAMSGQYSEYGSDSDYEDAMSDFADTMWQPLQPAGQVGGYGQQLAAANLGRTSSSMDAGGTAQRSTLAPGGAEATYLLNQMVDARQAALLLADTPANSPVPMPRQGPGWLPNAPVPMAEFASPQLTGQELNAWLMADREVEATSLTGITAQPSALVPGTVGAADLLAQLLTGDQSPTAQEAMQQQIEQQVGGVLNIRPEDIDAELIDAFLVDAGAPSPVSGQGLGRPPNVPVPMAEPAVDWAAIQAETARLAGVTTEPLTRGLLLEGGSRSPGSWTPATRWSQPTPVAHINPAAVWAPISPRARSASIRYVP